MRLDNLIARSLSAAEEAKRDYLKRRPSGQVCNPSRDAAFALPGYVKLLVKALEAERARSINHAVELDEYLDLFVLFDLDALGVGGRAGVW